VKVFHGTNVIIEQPKIMNRFKTLDFGEGFYTTENEEQARDFAVKICGRRSPSLYPIVNCYEFIADLNNFSILKFEAPDEKWLDFVVKCRKGITLNDKYDLIIGPVANDDVFGTIILYESGELDKESTIKKLNIKKLYDQVVFCNEAVLKYLSFIKSYIVEPGSER